MTTSADGSQVPVQATSGQTTDTTGETVSYTHLTLPTN